MRTMLRRVRGLMGISLLWAFGWLLVMVPYVIFDWTRGPDVYLPPPWIVGIALFLIGCWGAASGALFAVMLSLLERGRRWEQLSLPRVVTWGVIAGTTVPIVLGSIWWWLIFRVDLPNTVIGASVSGTLGGALAATTLLVARRREERALPRG